MNTLTPYRYPLDKTGTNPDNLVVSEYHALANLTAKCVAPTYGNFYTKGVIIRDYTTKRQLVHKVDYMFGEIQDMVSELYAKEICGYIVVFAPNVSAIEITYQALGGEYSYSMGSIIDMLESLQLDSRPVTWPAIIGKPDEWTPETHWHKSSEVYGMEYLVHAVERVRTAILMGDTASHDEIYKYIDDSTAEFEDQTAQVVADLDAHESNKANPHEVTKAQVGLGAVQNYGLATQAEAVAGTSNVKYMTPLRTAQAIASQTAGPLNAHISNNANPHGVTAAQLGLGAVQNYGIATTAEAQAGTSNVKYMTPLLVKNAIDSQAGKFVSDHEARKDNPHGVTAAQIGLDKVQNYPMATQAEAQAGQSNVVYMTPLRTREAIASTVSGGVYDDRFVCRDILRNGNIHVRGDLNAIFIGCNGVWRQVWPPVWQ